jgi:ubiquinol-cytochrome c reductase core subunit 2
MLVKHPLPRAVAASRQYRVCLSSAVSIARTQRTYAAAAATKTLSPSTPFTVSDVAGLRIAARDDGGPTTGMSVVVKAGSRYAPGPGLAHLLDKFAWKVYISGRC